MCSYNSKLQDEDANGILVKPDMGGWMIGKLQVFYQLPVILRTKGSNKRYITDFFLLFHLKCQITLFFNHPD